VRTTNEIREELDQAIARRAELWNRLAQGADAETSAELADLSKTIEGLWSEYRTSEARKRFGSPELILARARAEERLERDSRRVKEAA
jgi:PAS domain-containing protein